MVYDNTVMAIVEQVYLNPGMHKRALSKALGVTMPSIDYALKKLKKVILEKKSGNQHTFFLNYSTTSLTPLLQAIEYARFERFPAKLRLAVREFLADLGEKPVIAVLFGSVASGKYTSRSDIDIFLVFQDMRCAKHVENSAKKINLQTGLRINPVYMEYSQFSTSFHDSSKPFFRNIKEKKLILIGLEWWRLLTDEET